ncbi:MAG TPA: glycosyltransferase family 1 protein [Acidimicrobiales bacterium]|nr:glycosyltransferase family 1 protein [Acidimicrobiales bacterium]
MRVALTLEQCWHAVPGGTAVAAIELARVLDARDDIDVVGVAARHSQPPPTDWRPPIDVRHLWAPRNVLYELWHARLPIAPKVEHATGAVDVVHATGVAYPRTDAPVVVTIHDLAFLDDPTLVTKHGFRFLARGTALARKHASLVLCSSEATKADCVAQGFDVAKLRTVPLGVHARPATPDEVSRVRAKHGLTKPYVFFSGTVEPRKNLPRLLRAFAKVKRTDVDLVLSGPQGWNESLRADLAPIEARVHALGFVDRAELFALHAGAEVFCYPSIKEGFGLPVLEAMVQGTPVVTSASTSTAEVAGGVGLLVDPFDEQAIADALDRLLDDPTLAQRLGLEGQHRAETFTCEHTAELTIAAYREVVP